MIHIERDDNNIVTWTLDMPGRSQNVWNQASLDAFEAALGALQPDDRGVVITSAKTAWLAGADLDDLERLAKGGQTAEELHASAGALSVLLRRLETCGKPVVAALNGTALGGGFELALACHHRVCSDDERIRLGLPEATLGLLPGAGGTQRLPRLIGVQAAMPLLLEGKQVSPSKAAKLGIIDHRCPADHVVEAAKTWILGHDDNHIQPWDRKGFEVPGGGIDDGSVLQTFMVANAMFAQKTWGNYPAGKAILSCMYEGLRTTLDEGLRIEKRYMVSLLLDPTAAAMIRTLFLSLQSANKLERRPAAPPRKAPKTIGILGSGLMGAGIAFVAAKQGLDAWVLDVTLDRAQNAVAYATKNLDKAIARGRSTEEKKEAVLRRIHPTADYADLAGCDLVVEAVFEDRGVKAKVTQAAEAVLSADAIIGSNTSTLPITGLAEACKDPTRFIGLHFFSPVERMPLVEIIKGKQTSEQTLAWALDAVQALGKTPIVVNDARGFYTSRVFGTYMTEGMVMLQEGIAPALIEHAGQKAGMPMPPLALADEVGLGLMHQVGLQTKKDLGDAAPVNPSQPVLDVLVGGHDRSGRRGNGGFYDYDGRNKKLWSGLAAAFPLRAEQPSVDELAERFLMVQTVMATRCVDEGVIEAREDADVGAILGIGFPAWTGGPLSYVDRLGSKAFVERADALAATHGDRFAPPALMRTMAAKNTSFYG